MIPKVGSVARKKLEQVPAENTLHPYLKFLLYIQRAPGPRPLLPFPEALIIPPAPTAVSPRVRALGVLGEDQVKELRRRVATGSVGNEEPRVGKRSWKPVLQASLCGITAVLL